MNVRSQKQLRRCSSGRAALLTFAFSLLTFASAGEARLNVSESDLSRVERTLPREFPWPQTAPVQVKKTPAATDTAIPDLAAGDVIIKAMGEFSREENKLEKKEVLTLNKGVEIEQVQTQSVLRGNQIRVVNDQATGKTERLQATGTVEVVTPERKGRGESLVYEIKYGANEQTLVDLYTLEGDRAKNIRAVLWQGEDWIEAERFVNDRRLDTFRVMGSPRAVFRMPAAPQAPVKPAVRGGAGMMSGMSLSGGGKIKLQADGEMFFEGATGRLRITRNVAIMQEGNGGQPGLLMIADEVVLQLEIAPPGQLETGGDAKLIPGGGLQSLECSGRVEIKAPPRTIVCDRANLDLIRNRLQLEMKNAKDTVRVYTQESSSGGKVMIAPKSITVEMQSGEFNSPGAIRMENFTGTVPSARAGK